MKKTIAIDFMFLITINSQKRSKEQGRDDDKIKLKKILEEEEKGLLIFDFIIMD